MQEMQRTFLISTKLVLKLCFDGYGQEPQGGMGYDIHTNTQIRKIKW